MASMPDMTAVDNVRKHKIIDFVRVRSLLPNLREIRGAARVDDDHEISAVLYDDQIDALAPDEPGMFAPTASPATEIPVTRIAGPPVRHDRSTSMIRFHVEPRPSGGLPLGQVGWLKLASKSRAVLGVPVSAVLQSPEGPYVLAWKPGGQFEKRPIEIGETFSRQGFAVVLSGLRASDRVVSRATFFLDADRRLGGSAFAADSMPGTMPEADRRTRERVTGAAMIAALVAWSARHSRLVLIATVLLAIAGDPRAPRARARRDPGSRRPADRHRRRLDGPSGARRSPKP